MTKDELSTQLAAIMANHAAAWFVCETAHQQDRVIGAMKANLDAVLTPVPVCPACGQVLPIP